MESLSIFQDYCRKEAIKDLTSALGHLNNLTGGDPVEDPSASEAIDSAVYDIRRAIDKLS